MTDKKNPTVLDGDALAQANGGCNGGLPLVIAGTAGQDWIRGTDASEMIDGRFGNDIIYSGGGVDVVDGGDGADILSGGQGNDAVFGGAGDDMLVWGPGDGDDVLRGGADFDTLMLTGFNMSREELLAKIVVEEGSPLPSLSGSAIDLTGVRGTLVIGNERITFEGLEQLRTVYW